MSNTTNILQDHPDVPQSSACPLPTENSFERLTRVAWIPLPVFAAVACVTFLLHLGPMAESPALLATLNTIFCAASSLLIVYLAGRTYLLSGSMATFFMGCGALVFALAYLTPAPFMQSMTRNIAITLHNSGVLLAGICFLLSAAWTMTRTPQKAAPTHGMTHLLLAHGTTVAAFGLLIWAATVGATPEFCSDKTGLTVARHATLGLAVLVFLATAACFGVLYLHRRHDFLVWYALGMGFLGLGLGTVLFESMPGTPLSWLGRAGQYLGGAYLLVGTLMAMGAAGGWVLPLERALHESEVRYHQLVNLCPDAIMVHADGRYMFANPAAARLLGAASPEELIGREVFSLVHPDSHELVTERIRQTESGEPTSLREVRMLRLDGSAIHVEATGAKIPFQGRAAYQVVMRDITERKRSEAALAEASISVERSRLILEAIIQQMPAGIIITDETGLKARNNKEMDRIWRRDMPSVEHVDSHSYVAFHPDGSKYRLQEWPLFRALKNGETIIGEEMIILRGDGTRGTVLVSSSPVKDKSGQLIAGVIVDVDITQMKETEKALHSAMRRFALLAGTAEQLLVSKDPQDGLKALCRTVMEQLDCQVFLNYLADERAGRLRLNAWAGIPDEEARKLEWIDYGEAICGRSARDGCRIVAEHISTSEDARSQLGKDYGVAAYACHPLLGPGGKVLGTLSFGTRTRNSFCENDLSLLRAVTDQVAAAIVRIRTEQALRQTHRELEQEIASRTAELDSKNQMFLQSQKMEAVGRLAGGIAHDFNNLMTVVTGYGQRVLRDGQLGASHRSSVEQMLKAGERAVMLTKQLLAFSRKQVMQPVMLNLNEVIGDMGKMLPAVLGEDVELVSELEPQPWPVFADPNQISQAVMNLAANARDAMPMGGRLAISTTNVSIGRTERGQVPAIPAGEYVCLEIEDTGTGMTEEVREHLFEPFFTTKERGAGTGLGLSSVYGIVQQSDGHIRVRTAPGQGATFSIFFPRADTGRKTQQAEDDSNAAVAKLPRGTETILLVEDEKSLCDLVAGDLGELGYKVLPCHTVGDALHAAEAHRGDIDLLLTDVILPGVSGPTLARMITGRGSSTPVLYMSGHAEKHIVNHGILEPGVDFMHKPFTIETLATRVREALDKTEA